MHATQRPYGTHLFSNYPSPHIRPRGKVYGGHSLTSDPGGSAWGCHMSAAQPPLYHEAGVGLAQPKQIMGNIKRRFSENQRPLHMQPMMVDIMAGHAKLNTVLPSRLLFKGRAYYQ